MAVQQLVQLSNFVVGVKPSYEAEKVPYQLLQAGHHVLERASPSKVVQLRRVVSAKGSWTARLLPTVQWSCVAF